MAEFTSTPASSSLAPDVVREAVGSKDAFAATGSFGVVALVVLLLLLAERERLRIIGASAHRLTAVTACAVPLLVTFAIAAGARIAELLD